MTDEHEESRLRSAALQSARSILLARQRADEELHRTKEALERQTAALREETRVLELVNRTAHAMASTLELQELLQLVTDAATQLAGAEFGAFFYNTTDENGDAYQLFTLSGAARSEFEKLGHPRATAIFGPTFRGESVVRSADITEDPRYGRMPPHHGMPPGHLPVRSYLAVPVVSRTGETIGGLFFGHPERGVFGDRAERLIIGVAAHAAVAIDNARLYEDLKRAAEERQRLLDAERAARSELERVSLLKDEFLATLSHELRTPLNAVLGWAEMLRMRSADREDFRRGLEAITRNARAQAQMIEDLLDMTRIVTGKVRLDVQLTDLAMVVNGALDAVRPAAAAKQIRIRRHIRRSARRLAADPGRLQQVVWNLLSNAVKFTPRGGRVDISARRVESRVEIRVTDSGAGIDPGFLPHVFERFRQADASTTRKYGGLGLGLAIVKQLVELHGGTVMADSHGVGQGSTFTVHLPVLATAEPDEPGPYRADERELSLAGLKVLVVDDQPEALELLRVLLEDQQAEVLIAASADEALATLRAEVPDVVVSDIGMPGKDGYELIRELRRLPSEKGGRVPAIAVTAFAGAQDRTQARLAGYQVHLGKPVEPRELIAAIGSLAGRVGEGG